MEYQGLVINGMLERFKLIDGQIEARAAKDKRETAHLKLTSRPRTDTGEVTSVKTRRSPNDGEISHIEWLDHEPVTEYIDYVKEVDEIGVEHEYRELVQISRADNYQCPDNLQFEAMGLQNRENTALDYRKMDDRDFRERCVMVRGQLQVMYKRSAIDMQGPLHKRPEVLEDVMECSYADAHTISKALDKLGFDKANAQRIIYGYVTKEGVRKHGLKGIGDRAEHIAELLENIVKELPELGPMVADENGNPVHIVNMADANSLRVAEDGTVLYSDPNYDYTPDENEWEDLEFADAFGDETEEIGQSDLFHTYPLAGADQCDGDMLVEIASAEPDLLNYYRRAPFAKSYERINLYGKGRSDYWKAVNQRTREVIEIGCALQTKEDQRVLRMLAQCKYRGQAKALLIAYQNGSEYNFMGSPAKFAETPCQYRNFVLWSEYRKMKFKEYTANEERKVA